MYGLSPTISTTERLVSNVQCAAIPATTGKEFRSGSAQILKVEFPFCNFVRPDLLIVRSSFQNALRGRPSLRFTRIVRRFETDPKPEL